MVVASILCKKLACTASAARLVTSGVCQRLGVVLCECSVSWSSQPWTHVFQYVVRIPMSYHWNQLLSISHSTKNHPLSIQTAQCQVGLAHKSSVLGRTVWKTCRAGCPKLPKGVALTTVMQRDVYNTVLRFQIIKLVTKPVLGSTHPNHSKHQPPCGLVTSKGLIVVLY